MVALVFFYWNFADSFRGKGRGDIFNNRNMAVKKSDLIATIVIINCPCSLQPIGNQNTALIICHSTLAIVLLICKKIQCVFTAVYDLNLFFFWF